MDTLGSFKGVIGIYKGFMESTSVTENQMERTLGIYRGGGPCTV